MMPSARKKRRSVSNPLKKSSAACRIAPQRAAVLQALWCASRRKVTGRGRSPGAGPCSSVASGFGSTLKQVYLGWLLQVLKVRVAPKEAQRASGCRGSVSVSAAFFRGRLGTYPFGHSPTHAPAGGALLQGRPASAGTRRATFFSSTSASIFTMTSERLSPPPRARERAFSIRNSVASRGERESTTEPSSVGEK